MIVARFKKKITAGSGSLVMAVDLAVATGEFVALFGPSGAGKTTILRILAGLSDPDEGFIAVDGQVWFDSARKINQLPQERSVGFVFQEYNLFPHLTLRENLRFALDQNQDSRLIEEFLSIAGLKEVQDFKPSLLSGGQKQRAAVIRALIRRPRILLLDEPFSALDLPTRLSLQEEILRMHERFKTPTIMVTHDVADVIRMSRRVLLLEAGMIREGSVQSDLRPLLEGRDTR